MHLVLGTRQKRCTNGRMYFNYSIHHWAVRVQVFTFFIIFWIWVTCNTVHLLWLGGVHFYNQVRYLLLAICNFTPLETRKPPNHMDILTMANVYALTHLLYRPPTLWGRYHDSPILQYEKQRSSVTCQVSSSFMIFCLIGNVCKYTHSAL